MVLPYVFAVTPELAKVTAIVRFAVPLKLPLPVASVVRAILRDVVRAFAKLAIPENDVALTVVLTVELPNERT